MTSSICIDYSENIEAEDVSTNLSDKDVAVETVDRPADSSDKKRKLEPEQQFDDKVAAQSVSEVATITTSADNTDTNNSSTTPTSSQTEFMSKNKTEKSRPATDIYGRIPAKEPKYPISCPACSRIISVSRFAAHLEKCMGISRRSLSPTKR